MTVCWQVPEINGVSVVGQQLYSAAGDGVAYAWDLNKGACTTQFEASACMLWHSHQFTRHLSTAHGRGIQNTCNVSAHVLMALS